MGKIVRVCKTVREDEGLHGFVQELECGRVSMVTVLGDDVLDAFISRIASPVRIDSGTGIGPDSGEWVSAVDCRIRQEPGHDPYVVVDHGEALCNIQDRAEEAEALGLRWEA